MPIRPLFPFSVDSLTQYEQQLIFGDTTSVNGTSAQRLPSPLTPLRQYLDDDTLPRPDYFETLDELHDWYEQRFGTEESQDRLELCSEQKGFPTASTSVNDARPQLVVCHDFQGGYGERPDQRGYSFEYWHLTDLFIYFSHKRITVPPVGWINAAKRHDTKMLGTVIFEWSESVRDLSQLLRGPTRKSMPIRGALTFSPQYADELIELALERKFSGYLINVEVSLDLGFSLSGETWPSWIPPATRLSEMAKNAERLRAWVDYLRRQGTRRFQQAGFSDDEWQVMWYDSVVYPSGQLAWQDALSPNNVPFFQAAHTFFTNYTWARPPQQRPPGSFPDPNDPEQLQLAGLRLTGPNDGGYHPALLLSSAMADSLSRPRSQVFIGMDVFGRNCWGGMDSWRSLEMIGPGRRRKREGQQNANDLSTNRLLIGEEENDVSYPGTALELSVALFAPGWTWEHDEPKPVTTKGTSPGTRRSWEDWFEQDKAFWIGLESFSGSETAIFPTTSTSSANQKPVQSYFPEMDPKRIVAMSSKGLFTNFCLGSGIAWFVRGTRVYGWESAAHSNNDDDDKKIRHDEKLPGWTDIGVTMPKPHLLFIRTVPNLKRWHFHQQDAWSGNVSLCLELEIFADKATQIPLLTAGLGLHFPNSDPGRWRASVTFKCHGIDLVPTLETLSEPSLTIDFNTLSVTQLENDWQRVELEFEASTSEKHYGLKPLLAELGITIILPTSPSHVLDSTKKRVLIGSVEVIPVTMEAPVMGEINCIPGPVSDAESQWNGTIEWPDFDPITPWYEVFLSVNGRLEWLGTTTRESEKNEFCLLTSVSRLQENGHYATQQEQIAIQSVTSRAEWNGTWLRKQPCKADLPT